MQVFDETSLLEAYRLAVIAKRCGKTAIYFEVEAQNRYSRFLYLWEGTIGRVVGRVFAEEQEPRNPDLPPRPAAVARFIVEADATDVVNAYERRIRREREREVNVRDALFPLRVGPAPSTVR